MNQNHKNFWNMVKDVVAYFYANISMWTDISILKTNVEKLKNAELQLANADKTQKEKDPTGNTTQKDKQFAKMTKLGYKLGCKITSFALETKNQTLLPLVNFTLAQLEAGTENDVVARCQIIADKGSALLPQLEDYKVTDDEIDNFQKEIDIFKKMPPERDLVANTRKGVVKSIPEIVAEARDILEKLDNNVDGFIEDETFINGYHQIRIINSRRGSRNQAKSDQPAPAK